MSITRESGLSSSPAVYSYHLITYHLSRRYCLIIPSFTEQAARHFVVLFHEIPRGLRFHEFAFQRNARTRMIFSIGCRKAS